MRYPLIFGKSLLGSWHPRWRGKKTKASAGPLFGVELRALGGLRVEGLGVQGLEVSGLGFCKGSIGLNRG